MECHPPLTNLLHLVNALAITDLSVSGILGLEWKDGNGSHPS